MSESASERAAPQPLDPEDVARANLYALVGRLFYEAPDPLLLAELGRDEAAGASDDGALSPAWHALRAAAKRAYPVRLKQEHDTLFAGVGKAEVTPYTSHYAMGMSPDRQLVRLRDQLGRWGLARRDAAFEIEDHISGICDVMRILVEAGRPAADQRLFFNEFVYASATRFLDAVMASGSASFYRAVAEFARAFFELEKVAMEMEED